MIIRALDRDECIQLLQANRLARLACADAGKPYLVTMFYAYREDYLFAFTLPGRKLETMRANPNVAMLVESHGGGKEWKSVLAEGRFEELPDEIGTKRMREQAWSLLSQHDGWWSPGALKPLSPPQSDTREHIFFRINIERLSGREARDIE